MIQTNIPQKLSSSTLAYLLIRSVFISAVIFIFAYFYVQSQQYTAYKSLIVGSAIFLALLSFTFTVLWWKLFEYTIGESYIKIKSGVIFRSDKNINFNDIQSANAVFGPVLALFGLRQVRGFTSSPEQLVITSSKSGSHTQHVPDIQIIIDKQTAEELLEMMRKGDIQKVQSVS